MFQPPSSPVLNRGFRETFRDQRLTFGVFFPIEAFVGAAPTMRDQVVLAQRAERLGFHALWFRDVPLLDPDFGDVGLVFDPWVYLGFIAAQTRAIHLATYIDLAADPGAPASRIHLGYRLGRHALIDLLGGLRDLGVNHVAFNLKYGERPAAEVLEELGQAVLPHFGEKPCPTTCLSHASEPPNRIDRRAASSGRID